ncbi:hypothetical protein BH10PSE7_BH10PSE7_36120 [soil metagenome]
MSTIENESPGPVQPPVIDLDAEEVGGAAETDPPPRDPEQVASNLPPERHTPWRGILLACAAVIAAIAGSLFYRSYGETFWPSTERVALEERVATLEAGNRTASTQLQALASAIDGMKGDTAKTAGDLDKRIAAAEAAVKSLQGSLGETQPGADPALVARVDALEQAVAALKAAPPPAPQPTPEPGKGAELAAALASLQDKFSEGTPYKDEYAVISARVPDAPGLNELGRHADQGIGNAQKLAGELEAAAASLDTGEPAVEDAGTTVWGSIVSMLGSVIKVRTIGTADWKASAGEAASFARRGDLRAALERLAVDAAEIPPAIAAWRDKANARLSAEAALETVSAATLRVISAANRT